MYKAADEVLGIKHGDRTRAKSSCVLRITFLLHIKGDDSGAIKNASVMITMPSLIMGVNPQVNAEKGKVSKAARVVAMSGIYPHTVALKFLWKNGKRITISAAHRDYCQVQGRKPSLDWRQLSIIPGWRYV